MMDPKIVFCNEMNVAGKSIRTTNEDGRSMQDQSQFWQTFFKDNFLKDLTSATKAGIVLGVYTEYEKDETKPFTFSIGAEVAATSHIPSELHHITLPASKYAVFTSAPGLSLKSSPKPGDKSGTGQNNPNIAVRLKGILKCIIWLKILRTL